MIIWTERFIKPSLYKVKQAWILRLLTWACLSWAYGLTSSLHLWGKWNGDGGGYELFQYAQITSWKPLLEVTLWNWQFFSKYLRASISRNLQLKTLILFNALVCHFLVHFLNPWFLPNIFHTKNLKKNKKNSDKHGVLMCYKPSSVIGT